MLSSDIIAIFNDSNLLVGDLFGISGVLGVPSAGDRSVVGHGHVGNRVIVCGEGRRALRHVCEQLLTACGMCKAGGHQRHRGDEGGGDHPQQEGVAARLAGAPSLTRVGHCLHYKSLTRDVGLSHVSFHGSAAPGRITAIYQKQARKEPDSSSQKPNPSSVLLRPWAE